jgi:hypothetical protein
MLPSKLLVRPTAVKPLEGYRISVRYADGTAGEINLAHLAGRGVFKAWEDRRFFEAVRITSVGGIAWGEDIELCPDALFMQLTGKSFSELELG